MKVILIALLFSLNTFAEINQASKYANIYADTLINIFDKELKSAPAGSNFLQSDTYIKILAARDYIEHESSSEEVTQYGSLSILSIANPAEYLKVINKINLKADAIKSQLNILDQEVFANFFIKENSAVYYPSTTSAGSVSGNTFPKNVWSLTFDDGPKSGRTEAVVNNLVTHKQRATFFVLKKQVNKFPDSLTYIMENQMEVALHSYNHLNLNSQSEEVVEYEIFNSKQEIEDEYDTEISLFRLPYGSGTRNHMVRTKIADKKMIHIFWNVDTLDWKDKDPESIVARTKLQMSKTPNKSGVILFHDIHAQTVIASEMIMEYLNDEQKKVCTVGEVVDYINQEPQTCL